MDWKTHTKATHCRGDVVSHVTTLIKYSARNNTDTFGPSDFGYSQIIVGKAAVAISPFIPFLPYVTTCTHTQGPIHF